MKKNNPSLGVNYNSVNFYVFSKNIFIKTCVGVCDLVLIIIFWTMTTEFEDDIAKEDTELDSTVGNIEEQ